MKKVFLIAGLLTCLGASAVFAAAPVIFYSDLTSGPKTGGQNDQGLFVTIVGKDFGATRGGSNVTIGGGQAANYPIWTDTKITFQLGANAATGDIVVTNADGASNGIPFTVRAGNIYFVSAASPNDPGSGTFADPWRSPRSFFTAYKAGDTCYFRTGTYAGLYGNQTSRPYNISFYNTSSPSGAPNNEVAWVGYPGEVALFRANDDIVYNGAIELTSNVEYHTFAGLHIYGRGDGREQVRLYSNNNKLVNCDIEGIKTLSYAMIGVSASNLKIWGNDCHGATSGNKLDHIVYFQGGGDNVDVGWNYMHDNDIAVGPVFSWNLGTALSTNIRIHDNIVDCRNSSGILRLAGIWSGGGGDITFYNNIVIGTGGDINNDNAYNGIYVAFGTAYVYNNTFYLSKGAGSNYVINTYASGNAVVKNNIFYNQSSISYLNGAMTADSNIYYGGSGTVPSIDAHATTGNPLFVSAPATGTGYDLHLQAASPAIDKGVDTTAAAPRDFDGKIRAAGKLSLGAYEYNASAAVVTPPAATTAAISGQVKDASGNGVSGVSISLSGGSFASSVTDANGSYQFTGLAKSADYTLTPVRSGYTFTPSLISVTSLSGDVSAQNFTATAAVVPVNLYSIGGTITNSKGTAIGGVTVDIAGTATQSVTTSNDGAYIFSNLPDSGTYTVIPQKKNFQFAPGSVSVTLSGADVTGKDFTGTRLFHIKGKVVDTKTRTALRSIPVTLYGDGTRSTVTDGEGNYEFTDLPEENSYEVKTAKSGYYFEPPTRSTDTLTSSIDSWNFEGSYVTSTMTSGEMKVIGSASSRGTVNPDKGETSKIYFKGAAGTYECRIFTLPGELLWTSVINDVQEGTFEWAPGSVASGIYTANVRGPGMDIKKKIAIIR